MNSAKLLERKDEKARKKERETVKDTRLDRSNTIQLRIPKRKNLRSNRTFKKATTSFSIPGLDTLEIYPKSFITIGLALGAEQYFLEQNSEDQEIFHMALGEYLKACTRWDDFKIDDSEETIIQIGKCQDFLFYKLRGKEIDLIIENASTGYEDVRLWGHRSFEVNMEHCIVPIKSIQYFEDHKPELAELMYCMLNKFIGICDILKTGSDYMGYAEDMFESRLYDLEHREEELDYEEKEDLENLRVSKVLYERGGIIDQVEAKIKKAKNSLKAKIRKFKPKDGMEADFLDWIKSSLRIIEIAEHIYCFDACIVDQDSYEPVLPSLAIRFTWSENDAVYQEIYGYMQMHFQEGGLLSPTMALAPEELKDFEVTTEAEFLAKLTNFMREGKDLYYTYFEKDE